MKFRHVGTWSANMGRVMLRSGFSGMIFWIRVDI